MPMGTTSENVATRHQISRTDQDAFAMASHMKAFKAQSEGFFDYVIVPMETGTDAEHEKIVRKTPSPYPVSDPHFTSNNIDEFGNRAEIVIAALLMLSRLFGCQVLFGLIFNSFQLTWIVRWG